MSIKVANNRLIVPSLQAGFYQQLFHNVSGFQAVGERLIRLAENARLLRQTAQVEEAGRLLSNIPIREYQSIGQYYLTVCDYRNGELEKTQRIFEQLAETSFLSSNYRGRAMLSLAAIAARKGDYATELYYGLESLKVSSNLSIRLEALKGIAVIKSKDGNHKQAVKDAESLIPMLRYANPVVCYDCMNSLAVEFGEVGRIEEATNISNIVLASPFAFAYPQWRETGQEIVLLGYKSHSVVSVIKPVVENVIPLPVAESSSTPIQGRPARIVSYARFKKKMVKKANGENDSHKLPEDMSAQDMAMKILELITENKGDEEKLRKLMESAIKIFSEKK